MSEMSELTLTVIRLGFLAVLWLFVLAAVSVMRTDLFGRRVGASAPQPAAAAAPRRAPARSRAAGQAGRRASRGVPSTLVVTAGRPDRHHRPPRRPADHPGPRRTTPRSCSTTTTSPAGTPGSSRATASGSSRTWAPPTAPTSTAPRSPAPTPVPLGVPIRIGKTVVELRK